MPAPFGVGPVPGPQMPPPLAGGPAGSPAAMPAEHAVAQAKHLVEQYAHEPFHLAGALDELKAKYQAEKHGIIIKPAED